MKDKIFNKLKQAYTPLGLGDAVLLEHAGAIYSTGLVTDENIDAIIAGQKNFLEMLQRSNDKRVQDALASARQKEKEAADKAAAEAEAERLRKEEEQKNEHNKALEDMRQKARAEALAEAEERYRKEREEAQRKADEAAEAARKAAEDAARKADEERNKVPEWYTRDRDESRKAAQEYQKQLEDFRNAQKAQQQAYESQLKSMQEASEKAAKERSEAIAKQMEEFSKARQQQQEIIDALKAENDRIKTETHRRERQDFIISKAKDMGIPQYRIEEGFAGISEQSTDDEIVATLSTVAKNVKANQIPESGPSSIMSGGTPTSEEITSLAKALTKN